MVLLVEIHIKIVKNIKDPLCNDSQKYKALRWPQVNDVHAASHRFYAILGFTNDYIVTCKCITTVVRLILLVTS